MLHRSSRDGLEPSDRLIVSRAPFLFPLKVVLEGQGRDVGGSAIEGGVNCACSQHASVDIVLASFALEHLPVGSVDKIKRSLAWRKQRFVASDLTKYITPVA